MNAQFYSKIVIEGIGKIGRGPVLHKYLSAQEELKRQVNVLINLG